MKRKRKTYHSTSGNSSYKIWVASWIMFTTWVTICILGWVLFIIEVFI